MCIIYSRLFCHSDQQQCVQMIKCTAMLAAVHTALCHKWGKMQGTTQGGTNGLWFSSCVHELKTTCAVHAETAAGFAVTMLSWVHITWLHLRYLITLQTNSKTTWSCCNSWSCQVKSVHNVTILQTVFALSAPDTAADIVLGSLAGALAGTAPETSANKQHQL